MNLKEKRRKRYKRHRKVRGKISGTSERPRLCVFRSSKHIYAQLIDDEKNRVIASASDLELKMRERKKSSSASAKDTAGKKATEDKKELSRKLVLGLEVGKLIAKKAKDLNIETIIFDRGGYKYHGRVKSLADGARAGGLKF